MKGILTRLEKAYGYPLDTEFTAFVTGEGRVKINLLQCRPLRLPGESEVSLPESLPAQRVLFRASRMIAGGTVADIKFIIYVFAGPYAALPRDKKKSLGRVIGCLNRHPRLQGQRFMLMGPGRWGSSNLDLGINTSYAEINNAAVLVELAGEGLGQDPELSYGTHFFLDLVESNTIYLPVFPGDPSASFDHAFFTASPNIFSELLPGEEEFAAVIKVIEADTATGGKGITVAADPRRREAVCFVPA
jgi:hypothetical protein